MQRTKTRPFSYLIILLCLLANVLNIVSPILIVKAHAEEEVIESENEEEELPAEPETPVEENEEETPDEYEISTFETASNDDNEEEFEHENEKDREDEYEDEEEADEYEITVQATKVICDDESDLPNWGKTTGPDITSSTATDWVAEHEGCYLAEGWEFQWAVDTFDNPGDNPSTPAGDPWTSFENLTDSEGKTTTTVVASGSQVEVREVLKDGYIGYTYNNTDPAGNEDDYSAEMYCYDDVEHYDNFDFIIGPDDGEKYYCIAFNVAEDLGEEDKMPELSIETYNNVDNGAIVSEPGDKVKFTIKVKATENGLKNVVVVDLPPLGFDPIESSFALNGSTPSTDPGYASPGEWFVGDLNDGDEVVIEYEATISNNQQSGLFKTLAYAYGNPTFDEGQVVLSEAQPVGYINDDNFVGTSVLVQVPVEVPEAEANVDVDEKEEIKEVTTTLPATGANQLITLMAVMLILLGLAVKYQKKIRKYLHISVLAFVMLFTLVAHANAANLKARIYEPPASVTESFQLDFVVLSVNDSAPISVECYKKAPGDGSFSLFQTVNVIAGGNSGFCDVNNSVLITPSATPYEFKIKAEQDSMESETEAVSVTYNSDPANPQKPEDFDVDKDSCEYEIEFKTANDGVTTYVEVYRSSDEEFDVNSSSRIKTVNIGPNQNYNFTYNSCGDTKFFALRAFNSANEPSDVTNQEYDDVTTKTVEVINESNEGSSNSNSGNGSNSQGGIFLPEGSSDVTNPELDETTSETEDTSGTETTDETENSEESNPDVLGDSDKPFRWNLFAIFQAIWDFIINLFQ